MILDLKPVMNPRLIGAGGIKEVGSPRFSNAPERYRRSGALLRVLPQPLYSVRVQGGENLFIRFVQGAKYLIVPPCHKNLFLEDEAFRVRYTRAGEETEWRVTFKGANTGAGFHLRSELETQVEDGREMMAILERMDFKPLITVKKTRQTYCRGSVTICLDIAEGLGGFMEIEILDPNVGEEEAMERIGGIVAEMGLGSARVEAKNYLQLLIEQQG